MTYHKKLNFLEGFLLGPALVAISCGGDGQQESQTATCADFSCPKPNFPFVNSAFPVTDSGQPLEAPESGQTNAMVLMKPDGAVCLSGTLISGWAQLELSMLEVDAPNKTIVDALDATALDIAAIRFRIESPPDTGIAVQLISGTRQCSPVSECQQWGFYLGTEETPSPRLLIKQSQTVTAPIAQFYASSSTAPGWELDTGALAGIAFEHQGQDGAFEYCVRDVEFLDAGGNVVGQ